MSEKVQGTTMNFFLRQEEARKKTGLLVFLFIVAVVLTFLAVHTLVAYCTSIAVNNKDPDLWAQWLNPELILWDFLGVALVVLGGSFFKIASLSSLQGDGIAESLGGRLVPRDTKDPRERRLLNIVEEMALASGIHVPNVYVLDEEEHINAFAAGFTPNTSVIAVTSGALNFLSRDELQGVIAHEFSHIINGDTRISLRLMGILFGLEMLVLIGMLLVRSLFYIRFDSGSNSDSKGGGALIVLFLVLFGVGIIIIGWIGMFFSNIIRAAVSRQREFLADASAVQYTRNPNGIGGALKKIGCPAVGSQINNTNAIGAGHLFIGSVLSPGFFSSLFDTHPDLQIRIQRIDPSFDGTFPEQLVPIDPITGRSAVWETENQKDQKYVFSRNPLLGGGLLKDTILKGVDLPASAAAGVGTAVIASSMLDQIGAVDQKKLVIANDLLQAIPEELSEAAREDGSACEIIFAILLDSDSPSEGSTTESFEDLLHRSPVLDSQWKILSKSFPEDSLAKIREYYGILKTKPSSSKIPIVELAFPTLKAMDKNKYQTFRNTLIELIPADNKVDLFEYTVHQYLIRDLDRYFGFAGAEKVQYSKIGEILPMYQKVLSYLAYAGSDDPKEINEAFSKGCSEFSISCPILPKEECTPYLFGSSLSELAKASPALKKKLLSSFYRCIASDGIITLEEGELIRAIAATLDAPMPVWS